MANLKEIRSRISSVKSTMQITSAMKMVSAAKLKKAQDAITAMRPYANKLTELLQSLSATLDSDTGNKFAAQRPENKILVVAITSNRGLCGAFNSNVIKESIRLTQEEHSNAEVSMLTIGKKGNDILSKTQNIILNNDEVFDNLTFDNVATIAEILMAKFEEAEFDKIILVYNSFKNAGTQIVRTE
ncbi:MAG: F0F1 ATP synthase subunit gamma, partial [Flavobacteriaceae bacterium]|nr:F0F1 ATP synthase subunit gamma [Flavobacteriaceae bacterium]